MFVVCLQWAEGTGVQFSLHWSVWKSALQFVSCLAWRNVHYMSKLPSRVPQPQQQQPSAGAAPEQNLTATAATVHDTATFTVFSACRPVHTTMLRIEQATGAAATSFDFPSVTTDQCSNDLHSVGFYDNRRPATAEHESACACWHGRGRHRPELQHSHRKYVCGPATHHPGRTTRSPSVATTAVAVNTRLVCPSISTECFHNGKFHVVPFPTDNVYSCDFANSDDKHYSDPKTVDPPITGYSSLGFRSSNATDTTNSSSPPVRYGLSTACGNYEGSADIRVVLRRSLVAGIGWSAAVNFARDIPCEGFIRPQVPLFSQRSNREGSYQCTASLCLR
jgi:hypothetical protein